MSKGQSDKRRQKLVEMCNMSSFSDIKAFGQFLLQKEGIDLRTVNVSSDGIQLKQFRVLVMGVYELGYKDGLVQYGHAKTELRRLESEGKKLASHARKAKFMFDNSEINK